MSLKITRNADGAVSIEVEKASDVDLPSLLQSLNGSNGNGRHSNGNGQQHAKRRKKYKKRKTAKPAAAAKSGWQPPSDALFKATKKDIPIVKNLDNWKKIQAVANILKRKGHGDLDLRTVRVLCNRRRQEELATA